MVWPDSTHALFVGFVREWVKPDGVVLSRTDYEDWLGKRMAQAVAAQ